MRIGTRRWDGAGVEALATRLGAGAIDPLAISADVAAVVEQVRSGGDAALLEIGERFDGARPCSLWIERPELEAAAAALGADLRAALDVAAANIRIVAEAQLDHGGDRVVELPQGHTVSIRQVPVGSAAIYAPGGRAPYPSSVLMGVVPARVAGVERVAVASPPRSEGLPHPTVLGAAAVAGADRVLTAGGAQAIAALAHGTESVEPVDVIAGPGGPWVQEAKLQVSRQVGIDGYAGPSELMIICDGIAAVEPLALDLCAQAEHGPDSPLLVASPDAAALERIGAAVARVAAERPSVTDAALELVETPSLAAAAELGRALAPEHLQIACEGASELAHAVPTAGCIFIGPQGATAFGDYAAGSNHTLPTGRTGRFTGPLGPGTFMRPISEVRIDADSAAALAGPVDAIARAEGFPVHGESARARSRGSEASGPPEQAS